VTGGAAPITRQTDLTFGSVTIAGFLSRSVSFKVFFADTTYETGVAGTLDRLTATLAYSDATAQTLYDTGTGPSSGDLDNQIIGLVRNNYAMLTYNIPDSVTANSVILKLGSNGNSSVAAESFGYDEIIFSGTAVPEPTTLGLAGLSALGLLARRRRI
jgi:hypothetical protein